MAKPTTRLQIKRHKFNPFATIVSIKQQVKKRLGVTITAADIRQCWHNEIARIQHELIQNGRVSLSCKIGSLCIYKSHISDVSVFKTNALKKSPISLARLNYIYDIVYEKGPFVNSKVRFIPCAQIVNKKKEILKTNKDYKPAPLKCL